MQKHADVRVELVSVRIARLSDLVDGGIFHHHAVVGQSAECAVVAFPDVGDSDEWVGKMFETIVESACRFYPILIVAVRRFYAADMVSPVVQ